MKRIALFAFSTVLAACGGSSGPQPAPGQPPAFVQPNTLDPSTQMPASLGCVGTHTDPPAPTTATAVTMMVQDFEKKTPVAGATVDVYLSLAHVNAMAPDATSAPSDANGQTTLMVPPGSYRVIFRTTADPNTTIETIEFDRAYNDPTRISVSQATKAEIPALVSIIPDDTLGVVAGSQRDCNEKEMGGITFTATSSGGSFDASMSTFYFIDVSQGSTVPARAQKFTSADGVFAILNVPPGDVTVTSTGIPMTGGMLTTIGRAVVPVHANSITILQMEPLGAM